MAWLRIDFNSDGQTDFQIDHDRVDVDGTAAGPSLDYLQIDKNDINGESKSAGFRPWSRHDFSGDAVFGRGDNAQ